MIGKMMKTLGGMVLVLLCSFHAIGDTLYWQVDGSTEVISPDEEVNTVSKLLATFTYDPFGEDGDGMSYVYAARVNVCDSSGTILRYMENKQGNIIVNSHEKPIDIGHPNAPSGVGAIAMSTDENSVSTDLGLYYQISLLRGSHNEWNENFMFEEIAWTAYYQGAWLEGNENYSLVDGDVSELVPWIPERFYTTKPVPFINWIPVPEPSSFTLVLIGMGLLGLKRKRR